VPFDDRQLECLSHLFGQHGLAGTGFTLDQQWALQPDGGIDRHLQILGGDVGLGAFEIHGRCSRSLCRWIAINFSTLKQIIEPDQYAGVLNHGGNSPY
jgi:hypothetical protein